MDGHTRCPYEKAILSARCGCDMAIRFSVAEQMGVKCRSNLACNNCTILLGFMRESSRFALKITDTSKHLPFGKEMKVMMGGLIGLHRLINADKGPPARVENIHALVQQAQENYHSLSSLPYQEIMKSIVAFQSKRRSKPRSAR